MALLAEPCYRITDDAGKHPELFVRLISETPDTDSYVQIDHDGTLVEIPIAMARDLKDALSRIT